MILSFIPATDAERPILWMKCISSNMDTSSARIVTTKDGRTTMKIVEAIVYVLAERNGGLKTEQIAEIINRRQLHVHKDEKHPYLRQGGGKDNAFDVRVTLRSR